MTLFYVESRVGHVLFSAEGKDRANQVVQDMFNGTRRGCLFCFRIVISTCDVHDAFSNINVNRTSCHTRIDILVVCDYLFHIGRALLDLNLSKHQS